MTNEANSLIQQADLDAAPVEILYRYANLLEAERNIPEAIRYLEAAYKRSQEHHIVHSLARLNKEIGNYRGAIKFYNLALKDVDNPFSILRMIADCYYFLEDYTGCVFTVSKSILLGSTESSIWSNLTYALIKLGLSRSQASDYLSFLTQKLNDGDHITDEEVLGKIHELRYSTT